MLRFLCLMLGLYVSVSSVIAQERRDLWCRYQSSDGETVLERKCDVVAFPSTGCEKGPILGGNYVLGFSVKSKAVVLDGCAAQAPVQVNGHESFPNEITANGRKYFSAPLRDTGETFEFEPITAPESGLAPWSEEWMAQGDGGECYEFSRHERGRDRASCIKAEICSFPLADGEGGCHWLFHSPKGLLAKISRVEDPYFLDGYTFSENDIIEVDGATCYPRGNKGIYFCFVFNRTANVSKMSSATGHSKSRSW